MKNYSKNNWLLKKQTLINNIKDDTTFNLKVDKKKVLNEIPKNCNNKEFIVEQLNNLTNGVIFVRVDLNNGNTRETKTKKNQQEDLIKIIELIQVDEYFLFKELRFWVKNNIKVGLLVMGMLTTLITGLIKMFLQ